MSMQFSTVVFVGVPNWKESVVGLCGTPSMCTWNQGTDLELELER